MLLSSLARIDQDVKIVSPFCGHGNNGICRRNNRPGMLASGEAGLSMPPVAGSSGGFEASSRQTPTRAGSRHSHTTSDDGEGGHARRFLQMGTPEVRKLCCNHLRHPQFQPSTHHRVVGNCLPPSTSSHRAG